MSFRNVWRRSRPQSSSSEARGDVHAVRTNRQSEDRKSNAAIGARYHVARRSQRAARHRLSTHRERDPQRHRMRVRAQGRRSRRAASALQLVSSARSGGSCSSATGAFLRGGRRDRDRAAIRRVESSRRKLGSLQISGPRRPDVRSACARSPACTDLRAGARAAARCPGGSARAAARRERRHGAGATPRRSFETDPGRRPTCGSRRWGRSRAPRQDPSGRSPPPRSGSGYSS